jgi:hypothetical protein
MKIFIGLMLVLLTVGSGFAQVRTFVSTAGNDANPCTLSQPCRNFGAAVAAVASGGEVVALDSGGYGPVTISKAVSLVAPLGVHAAIAPTSGTAIEVNVGSSERVVLRGLFLNSQGASYGIQFLGGETISLERLIVRRFTENGVLMRLGNLIVSDSVLSENNTGIYTVPYSSSYSITAALTRTVFANSDYTGVLLAGGSRAVCRECNASGGIYGFRAAALAGREAEITLERSVASHNTYAGVGADSLAVSGGGNAVVRLSNTTVTSNARGVDVFTDTGCSGCVQMVSRGNNTVESNSVADGTFTAAFAAK